MGGPVLVGGAGTMGGDRPRGGRRVQGSAAWLDNARKGMDHCIRETIKEVRELEAQVKNMEADRQAAAGRSMAPQMQEAVAYLQERQANLDWQGLRTVVLDTLGIWVWDPKKKEPTQAERCVVQGGQKTQLRKNTAVFGISTRTNAPT